MPRNPIVNRRNLSDLKRRTVSISDDAHNSVKDLAAKLHVSQGSLMDAALRELARMPDDMVVQLLIDHGHLTAAEADAVSDNVDKHDNKEG